MAMTVSTALDRIEHLIPTYLSPNLVADGVWVLTMPGELPERFRASQRERNARYMSTGDRTAPAHALRYLVRSYGVPIAWVTLDGRVHWADDLDIGAVAPHMPRFRTMLRHRDAVLARWPQRFALNDEDGEVSSRPAV